MKTPAKINITGNTVKNISGDAAFVRIKGNPDNFEIEAEGNIVENDSNMLEINGQVVDLDED